MGTTEISDSGPLKVIGYCRVSTVEQADSGAGLAAQEATIRAECDYRGWELVKIATDTGSGKAMSSRIALNEALAELDTGEADALCASKLDRVSRSVADFAQLMARSSEKGWALVMLDLAIDTTTPNGEMIAGIMSVLAQWERRIIGQRTKDALAARKAAGVALGRPRMDPAVRARIVEMRQTGLTFRAIATKLNEDAVPTAQGGAQWHPSTIRKVVAA